jgi:hypothetical protein
MRAVPRKRPGEVSFDVVVTPENHEIDLNVKSATASGR